MVIVLLLYSGVDGIYFKKSTRVPPTSVPQTVKKINKNVVTDYVTIYISTTVSTAPPGTIERAVVFHIISCSSITRYKYFSLDKQRFFFFFLNILLRKSSNNR